MEQDEADTFHRLRTHWKDLFEPEIERQHGRIFKLMGDGLLAEFGSVVDAVECAAALQGSLSERNASLPKERRIDVRIGINLGEVIVEGEDRYGEGVNIAARLQELAEPGGICVSGKVAKEVEKKLSFALEPIGEQQVKNIAEPVSVYRVVRDGTRQRPQLARSLSAIGRRRVIVATAVFFVLLAATSVGAYYLHQRHPAPSGPASIAVLPFVNMSGDSSENYLGEGFAEDVITALAKFPIIHVVSRTSSFVYDNPVKVQQVGQDLGVGYILEGSVRKSGGKICVTTQLIDAATGDHIWADRFDGEGDDVVALQEEIANKVYGTIAGLTGEIVKHEEANAWAKSAVSLEEYDYYMRGHALFLKEPLTEELNAQARQIWEEGLAKFPDSAILRIKICFTYEVAIFHGWSKDPGGDVERAWKLATEAQAVETKSRVEIWLGHWVMAFLYQWHDGDFARSVVEAEAAIEMVPNDGHSLSDLAQFLANAGRTDEAIQWGREAIRLEPKGHDWYHYNLGWAYYVAGRPEQALAEFKDQPGISGSPALAAAYARLGQIDTARAKIAELEKILPGWTIAQEARYPGGKQPQLVEPFQKAYLDDLRKAGLPE